MAESGSSIELICVGTELLQTHVNTHERYIGSTLKGAGLRLSRCTTLPDDQAALTRAVREAMKRCDALILSGGLGPTFDDVTREAVAAALGRRLVYKPALFSEIERKLARHRMAIPERNKRQAFLIEGFAPLRNGVGSAPGQWLSLPRRGRRPQLVALLPGPYAELSPIFERAVVPRLRRLYSGGLTTLSEVFRLHGLPESVADERLKALTAAPPPGAEFTILAGSGQVDFHATVSLRGAARARALMAEVRRRVLAAVGERVFGGVSATLESAVGQALKARGWTLAAAESCTGGALGKRLTDAAGSSAYFRGGVVAYHNDLKRRLLGVSARTLQKHGAVSEECAREMARGARKAAGATLGVSITGVAGPSGGTAAKPVGLVCFALAGPGPRDLRSMTRRLGSDRASIRVRAVSAALGLTLETARKKT